MNSLSELDKTIYFMSLHEQNKVLSNKLNKFKPTHTNLISSLSQPYIEENCITAVPLPFIFGPKALTPLMIWSLRRRHLHIICTTLQYDFYGIVNCAQLCDKTIYHTKITEHAD